MKVQNKHVQNTLVVVSAKEHGKIYKVQNGNLILLEHVEEHPPTYSDNEGFFTHSGDGVRYGSGNPRETDSKRNLDRYMKAISDELKETIDTEQPDKVLLFEPEHLKGNIADHLKNPQHIPVATVAHGNYVDSKPTEIAKRLETYKNSDNTEPTNPASVAGEKNAKEKRKILKTAKHRYSGV